MLNLPDVTLFAIDCFTPQATWLAMRESMRWVKFGAVMLATDTRKPVVLHHKDELKLHIIERQHSNAKKVIPGVPPLPVDYELDVLMLPAEHMLTDFVLFMEWDAGVLNPDAWDPRWFRWDYIGAPWPDHWDAGWPACNESNNVGNGGFSLKSRRFCSLIAQAAKENAGKPEVLSSDRWQCRTMRPWLEDRGVRFAPEEVAARFSCENKIYSGQFGYHGRLTAQMNGWGGRWLGNVRPKV